MEETVLCDGSVFTLKLSVNKSCGHVRELLSKQYDLFGAITFQVKHKSFYSNNNFNSVYYEIVTLNLKKNIDTDPFQYSVALSCPEFDVDYIIEVNGGNSWRVLNDGTTAINTYTLSVKMETMYKLNSFAALYDDAKCIDFKLKGKDGVIEIHKVILAAVSPVFKSMLETLSDDFIQLPEASVSTLKDFKNYVYLNRLPNGKEELKSLLLIASYFNIKSMELQCTNKVIKGISPSDAVEFLEFAVDHKLMAMFLGILEVVQNGKLKVNEIIKYYLSQ